MLKFIQNLSALCFYLLGVSFFVAYLLMYNNVAIAWSAWWMQVADLPLIVSAVTYAGTSFVKSTSGRRGSAFLAGVTLVACGAFLAMVLVLNFWGTW